MTAAAAIAAAAIVLAVPWLALIGPVARRARAVRPPARSALSFVTLAAMLWVLLVDGATPIGDLGVIGVTCMVLWLGGASLSMLLLAARRR